MLSEENLKAAGPSCVALHNHYMLESANGFDNICVSYQACHFGSTANNFMLHSMTCMTYSTLTHWT
jgi:hypothetical protein